MGVQMAALHALALGGLGAYLTFAFTSQAGQGWELKDYAFVLAVVAAVFYNRMSTMKYETLIQQEHGKMRRAVHLVDRVEWVHGPPRQIETNKVTLLLFFGTWCKDSRAGLQAFESHCKMFTHPAVQFVALTQEKREELAAYEVKGRSSPHFQELQDFPFTIGMEDGLMSKQYLVRFEIYRLPQLFIIGKDKSVLWYGKPSAPDIAEIVRNALAVDNVPMDNDKLDSDDPTTAVVSKKHD